MTAPLQVPSGHDPAAWLGALTRVMARVTANADRQGVLAALAAGLVDEFGVDLAFIWVYDPADDALHLRAHAGSVAIETSPFTYASLGATDLPVVKALAQREWLIVDQIRPEDGFTGYDAFVGAGLQAYVAFPLVVEDRLCGAASMLQRDPWPKPMLDALAVLAQQAALALDHARLIEESQTLQSIAAELASARDMAELFQGLAVRSMAAIGADACVVWMGDEQGRLQFKASHGISARAIARWSAQDESLAHLFRQIQRSARPMVFADFPAALGEVNAELADAAREEGIVTCLRLPLFEAGGRVTGVLALYHRRERTYGESEVRLAQAFADQIAVAIHNAHLAEQERAAREAAARQLERLTTLAGITEQLLASSDLETVLRVVVEAAVHLCRARAAAVMLVDQSGRSLTPAAGHGDFPEWFAVLGVSTLDRNYMANSATGQALTRGEAVLVTDYAAESLVHEGQINTAAAGVRSFIAAPLKRGDTSLGVLWIADTLPNAFTAEDASLAQALAQQAVLAFEQARLIEESHALQVIAAELASTRDTRALLEVIVQRTRTALAADACAVWLLDAEARQLRPGAASGLSQNFLGAVGRRDDDNTAAAFAVLQATRGPWFSADAAGAVRERAPILADALVDEGIVSSLRLPLFDPGGEVIGMVGLYHHRERLYSDGEVRLAQAFTDQAAVALHNANLAGQERAARDSAARQLDRVHTLAGITEQLLASTDLDSVLRVVAEAGWRLSGASGAMVGLLDEERRHLVPLATSGEPRAFFEGTGYAVLDEEFMSHTVTGQAIGSGQAVAVEDYAVWETPVTTQRETVSAGVRAVVAAPIRLNGTPIGLLWVNDIRPRAFVAEDVAIIQTLADQAALAIEHARLMVRSQEATVLEERARLARDLHDSVTQSMFSLGMLTRAAQTQHERGSERLGATLDRIGTLAEDALKEMRALLFQLRPPGLEEGLTVALEKLAVSFRVRSDMTVTFVAVSDCRLTPDVEAAIFRIVQEALGNAVKHANASEVRVCLERLETALSITVRDNGAGFDPEAPATGAPDGRTRLGMVSMRERAAAAGVVLRIVSTLGAGTTVSVEAPLGPAP